MVGKRGDVNEASRRSVGEYVEDILADLLGTFSRFISTIFFFTIRPHRAAAELSKEPPDYTVLVRPHTFLLLGCLFYSVVLSAIELSIAPFEANTRNLRHTDTTEALAAGFQQLLTDGPSFLNLVIKTLPILIVASLFAVLAGHIFKSANSMAKTFFLYLYGLQGSVILLLALSMETQGEVLQFFFRGDDYMLLVIPTLVLGIAIQAMRCLWTVLDYGNDSGKVARALYNAKFGVIFGVLFLAPMLLSGYIVVAMHQSVLQISKENRERAPGPAIRIIEVTPSTIDGARMNIKLTAVVENRSQQTLTLRPSDVELNVYFVSPTELSRLIMRSPGLPSNVYRNLDNYDRFRVHIDEARIETGVTGRDIWTLAPASEGLIDVAASQEVTSFWFRAHERDRWKYRDDNFATYRRLLREREEPIRKNLEEVPEQGRLAYVAGDRAMIVQLKLRDHTTNKFLNSGFYSLNE